MSKVTFEFDENEDRYDVNLIVNRHKLVTAVNELSDLFRRIYNGKRYDDKDSVYIKADVCVATEEDYKRLLEMIEFWNENHKEESEDE